MCMVGIGNNKKYGADGQDGPYSIFLLLGVWFKLISSTIKDCYFAKIK